MAKIDENYFKLDDDMQAKLVEDILEEDENVLLRLKPNKKAYIWSAILTMLPIAIIWATIDVGMFIGIMSINPPAGVIWGLMAFFALHLIPVWIWLGGIIRAVLQIKNIEYAFTEKRIIVRSGIVGIDFKNLYYTDIEGVNLKVGALDKLFKVGDIYIQSLKQSTVLKDVTQPYQLLSKLQKITLDIKTDIHYPNDLRPNENHGYNTKYKSEF